MSTPQPRRRHEVFQTSLMGALLDGIYDGDLTIGELLEHGDLGLGTFEALDGELAVLDGVAHQMLSDGTVRQADPALRVPFAVVTRFVPMLSRRLSGPLGLDELTELVTGLVPSENYLYALRLHGRFSSVTTRTVARQSKPYPPLTEATDQQAELTHHDLHGTLVGFHTPDFQRGISVPGDHLHVVDDEHTTGGHVLALELADGLLELCLGTDLHLRLPLGGSFAEADLVPDDLDSQVSAAEG